MREELAENGRQFQLPFRNWSKALWRGFWDALYPSQCLICHIFVQEPQSLCVDCWQKIRFLEEPLCDVMGTGFSYETAFDQGAAPLSAAAIAQPPAWNRSRAAVSLDDHSKEIVHAFKYGDSAASGLFMARMMARVGHKLISQADMLVPVPLHWTRLWQRRFNQAGFLAKYIAYLAHKPYEPFLLERLRATVPQVGLDRAARRKNLRQAFGLGSGATEKITGKSVLLVDDVRTTGATVSACVAVLKAGGAARVDVLSFALVDLPLKPNIRGDHG